MTVIFKHDYVDSYICVPAGTRVKVTWFDAKQISFTIDYKLDYKIEFERVDQSLLDGFSWRDYTYKIKAGRGIFKWLKGIGAHEMEIDGVKIFSIHDPDLHQEIDHAPSELYDLYDELMNTGLDTHYFTEK